MSNDLILIVVEDGLGGYSNLWTKTQVTRLNPCSTGSGALRHQRTKTAGESLPKGQEMKKSLQRYMVSLARVMAV